MLGARHPPAPYGSLSRLAPAGLLGHPQGANISRLYTCGEDGSAPTYSSFTRFYDLSDPSIQLGALPSALSSALPSALRCAAPVPPAALRRAWQLSRGGCGRR